MELKVFKEFADRQAVDSFLSVLSKYNYCVIGGLAVALYSKAARKVSPDDLDVYVDESQIEDLLNDLMDDGFKILRNHNFNGTEWYVVAKGDKQEFDIAIKKSGSRYFQRPNIFKYKNFNLKVIAKELLVVNKLVAKRDKDKRDLLYLLKDEDETYFKMIRSKVSGEEKELLAQIIEDLENWELMVSVYGG